MKKVLKFVTLYSILLVFVVSTLNFGGNMVFAADYGSCGKNVYWSFERSDGVLTISGNGRMFNYEYKFDNEHENNAPWKHYSDKITKVVVSEGVTYVGAYSFAHLTILSSVKMADSVKEIGEYAFGDCFMLSEVDIGACMQTIGFKSFAYTNLKTINYNGTEEKWNAIEKGKLWRVGVSESQVKIHYSNWQLDEYTGVLTVIPAKVDMKDSIPWKAYSECIKKVIILEGVKTIGDYWFAECDNLVEVQLPKSLEKIGDGAFANCKNLSIVNLPENIQEIGYAAFRATGLRYVTLPDSVTVVEGYAFADCKNLSGIKFTKGIQELNDGFLYCCNSIKELELPDTLKEIGRKALSYTSISKIKIPASVTTIGASAFENCLYLEEVELGTGIKTLGDFSFSNSNLKKVFYNGTKEQWDQVAKSNTWNNGTDKDKLIVNYIKNGVMTDYSNHDSNIINVIVDGNYINFDTKPQFVNGRTMVPMRRIFEELGASVQWDNATWTAIAKKDGVEIRFTIDDYTMYKNGSPNTLDVPAQLINGRTLVPLRAVSEAFGCDVGWDGGDNIVSIISDRKNFTMLYAQDGRSRCFAKTDADKESGWYSEPSVMLYSCEKGQYFLQSQVEQQLKAGWSYTRGHNWRAATCTSPKTCTRCGATSGGTAPHSFNKKTGKCDYCSTNMSDDGGMSSLPD